MATSSPDPETVIQQSYTQVESHSVESQVHKAGAEPTEVKCKASPARGRIAKNIKPGQNLQPDLMTTSKENVEHKEASATQIESAGNAEDVWDDEDPSSEIRKHRRGAYDQSLANSLMTHRINRR